MSERDALPNEDWQAAGWIEGEIFTHGMDFLDYIGEVLGHAIDYMADAGYVG